MPAPNPFISILNGFAEAQSRVQRCVEREVHHDPSGERPVGTGWLKISTDNSGYSVWERWSNVGRATHAA